jgi:membrane-associated phospholipid phosphatase
MPAQAGIGEPLNYFSSLFALARQSLAPFLRPPTHARRGLAARRLGRQTLLMTGIVGAVIVVLMVGLDAWEISQMPPRGTPGLWPVRILTDFGKDAYVLWFLAGMLLVVALVGAAMRGTARARWLGFGLRVQFVFCAVLAPLLAGEVIKWVAGRGRPFVDGSANPFDFVPFAGTEAHASLPSAHAITAFALAFAVAAVWPRARGVMIVYAVAIALSRLVLLAHHPSDVVAGGLIGVVGAMAARCWFAERRLGFAIHRNGEIVPFRRFSGHLKRVARGPSAP